MYKYSEYYAGIKGDFCSADIAQIENEPIVTDERFRQIIEENSKTFDERFIGVLVSDLQFYVKKHAELIRSRKNVQFVKEIRKELLRAVEGRYGEKDGYGRHLGITPDFFGLRFSSGYLMTFNGSSIVVIVQNDSTIRIRDAKLLL
ncbi:hypothetical protein J6Z48_01645 [bacterium]|nr:hypothetical protein [bacterium]